MKLLTLLFSFFTVVYLSINFYNKKNTNDSVAIGADSNQVFFPIILNNELLDIEKAWKELKNARASDDVIDGKKEPQNKNLTFQLDEKKYTLYGIFSADQNGFALIMDENNKLIKLAKGEKLADDITLLSLQSDKISFDKNNQIIEFKLFERKNNAKN
ncbi:hypothetical protein AAD001_11540 [Colwelliaceae bacterium 6471]